MKIFRSLGCTVQCLHAVGMGCPDLLIGYKGINLLVEIKNGSLRPSARKLTPPQQNWHSNWSGQVCTVKDGIEAVILIEGIDINKQSV